MREACGSSASAASRWVTACAYLLPRQRRAAEAVPRHGGARLNRQPPLEKPLRRVRPVLCQPHLAKPDQGRHVGRFQRERQREEPRRFVGLVPESEDVAEVVGPPHVGGHQGLRVRETGFRGVEIFRGDEEPAHRAVRVGQIVGGRGGVADFQRQRRMLIAQLRLDRAGRAGHVGQQDLDAAQGERSGPSPPRESTCIH